MSTNIEITNTEYYINNKKKIVTCILYCRLKDLYMDRHVYFFEPHWFKSVCPNMKNGKFKCKGIAYCHKEDVFDVIKGKRIAESKAKKCLFNAGRQMHNIWISKYEQALVLIKNCEMGNKIALYTENAHYESLKS